MRGGSTDNDSLVEGYRERTLENNFPELIPYLRVGANVLDIGCGPGTITLGVAGVVVPGDVVGIDPGADRIDAANQLAKERGIMNVSFKVGDAHDLDFPDNAFDVVYSHTVVHHLIDPVKAFREQKRVAKPGGWVIATGVRDWGFSSRYPAFPKLDKVWNAVIRWNEWLRSRQHSGEHVSGPQERKVPESNSLDLHAGRRCAEWFSKAGLKNFHADVKVVRVNYQGAGNMEPGILDIVPAIDPVDGPTAEIYEEMVKEGFLDRKTFDEAREELVEWYKHPYAFQFWAYVFAAGKA